jgi:hypothetical protein
MPYSNISDLNENGWNCVYLGVKRNIWSVGLYQEVGFPLVGVPRKYDVAVVLFGLNLIKQSVIDRGSGRIPCSLLGGE